MSKLLYIVLGAIILAGAVWAYYTFSQSSTPTSTTPASSQSGTPEAVAAGNPVATITFSGAGFSPSSVTVKSGDTIAITNNSTQTIQFNSNPHPTHTDNPELNVGTIPPGETMKVKLTTKGTWGYHNHLNVTQGGTIIVQ